MQPKFALCTLLPSPTLTQAVSEALSDDLYAVIQNSTIEQFCKVVEQKKHQLDCLIVQNISELPQVITWLHGNLVLLPLVIVEETQLSVLSSIPMATVPSYHEDFSRVGENTSVRFVYHAAEVAIPSSKVKELGRYIEAAIEGFIKLAPICWVKTDAFVLEEIQGLQTKNLFMPHQEQLIEKLKERLGYLGVYYKRDPRNFFRHLSPPEKNDLLNKLKEDYREIVLCYFGNDGTLNQRIDDFVNMSFFADVSVSQIVEIHMELMDTFSKQLKLEGRSEDILLDYRLTLIDVIAHLCEMYRRSIPREV